MICVGCEIEKVELPLDLLAQPQAFEMMLEGDLEILTHAERLEDARNLKFDADATPDSVVRLKLRDVAAIVKDLPACRLILAEDQRKRVLLPAPFGPIRQ